MKSYQGVSYRQSFLDVWDEFEVLNCVTGTHCPADSQIVHRVAVLDTELEHTKHYKHTNRTLTSSSVVASISIVLPTVVIVIL